MPAQTEFPLVFEKLKSILKPYAKKLTVKTDTAGHFYLDAPYSKKWKKELFFASVQIKKNYVSFYLIYVPRSVEEYLIGTQKTHAGKILLQFQEDRKTSVRGVRSTHEAGI